MSLSTLFYLINHKSQKKHLLSRIVGAGWIAIALSLTGCEQAIEYLPPLPNIEIPSNQSPQSPQLAQTPQTAQVESQIRQQINQVRQKNGLQPLQNNEKLAQVARKYSRQMIEENFFSHTGIDGSTLSQRVRAGNISYWIIGENLFRSKNISQPVSPAVEGWLESPGHRANILRPVFRETGVGVWRKGNTYVITQLFLRG
ncbi:CAP domain-containing protein [Tolypothrix sp. FACHB-123]|uniref:CAP domain-containing protein n=1 Tax=Tolypothrix sp. FACHB-123 TaxID=2692868 RepID=UPI00168416C6|nr:CAP domain-containing protein [Tolypothrix sp. FACHB-123]MBD2354027.1 CAP domain-containing protein [Tolypothrix sp. FACHB-123]